MELKNGETFNGHLVNCDNFMNITLREVYQTNSDGDRFWKLKECYIRGSTVCSPCLSTRRRVSLNTHTQIKYLRVPDTLLDAVKDEQSRAREARGSHTGGRGTPRECTMFFPRLLTHLAGRGFPARGKSAALVY